MPPATRREFLQRAPLALLPLALPGGLAGCARRGLAAPPYQAPDPNLPGDTRYLPPVHVSADREIRTVSGLRPFRPSGFRVEREAFGATAVVHNYGHGGGGITLSWGTAKVATDLGLQGYTGPVAVLGCGIIGLTTAIMAQQAGFAVTIYTKAMPPNTTSNIAGGQWGPSMVYGDYAKLTPGFIDQYDAALKYAYERTQLYNGSKYGVRWMRNYLVFHEAPAPGMLASMLKPKPGLDDYMPERHALTPEQNPFGSPLTLQFDGQIMEPPIYLAALLADFRVAGGRVARRDFQTTAEVQALDEKLVFNCTGLGAGKLFNDTEITPVKGQLTFLLPQPEVTYATQYRDTYMFSRADGILLGGTHEPGNYDLTPDPAAKARILGEQAELFNGMRRPRQHG